MGCKITFKVEAGESGMQTFAWVDEAKVKTIAGCGTWGTGDTGEERRGM